MKLTFLGAAETVTGSKTLLELDEVQLLIDCGMYQGLKNSKELNSTSLNINFEKLRYIFLTHGHLDHCGYLPLLVKAGFKGKIICTPITKQIVQVILQDSVNVQKYDIKKGKIDSYLYDEYDVENTLTFFKVQEIGSKYSSNDGFEYEFFEAGHIIGASSLIITSKNERICFSGDLGRQEDILHKSSKLPTGIDYLILESTYGNRIHHKVDTCEILKKLIAHIIETKGVLLIPAFAIARTQVIIQYIYKTFQENPELEIPVFLDSPMGIKATKIYESNMSELKVDNASFKSAIKMVKMMEFGKDLKKLKKAKGPFILISSSGMINGGKIFKYFDMFAKHEKNTILLTGYQAEGTIGRDLLEGGRSIKLFGHTINVRANVDVLSSLSAHADKLEITNLIKNSNSTIKSVYLNHGEPESLISFQKYLTNELSTNVIIAKKNEEYILKE